MCLGSFFELEEVVRLLRLFFWGYTCQGDVFFVPVGTVQPTR